MLSQLSMDNRTFYRIGGKVLDHVNKISSINHQDSNEYPVPVRYKGVKGCLGKMNWFELWPIHKVFGISVFVSPSIHFPKVKLYRTFTKILGGVTFFSLNPVENSASDFRCGWKFCNDNSNWNLKIATTATRRLVAAQQRHRDSCTIFVHFSFLKRYSREKSLKYWNSWHDNLANPRASL